VKWVSLHWHLLLVLTSINLSQNEEVAKAVWGIEKTRSATNNDGKTWKKKNSLDGLV
jgi:hypothetical protein